MDDCVTAEINTVTAVTMTCMTTKKQFDVEEPNVIVLKNGRYAYHAKCPWLGKNEKELYAFKFCSAKAYTRYCEAKANLPTDGVQDADEPDSASTTLESGGARPGSPEGA